MKCIRLRRGSRRHTAGQHLTDLAHDHGAGRFRDAHDLKEADGRELAHWPAASGSAGRDEGDDRPVVAGFD